MDIHLVGVGDAMVGFFGRWLWTVVDVGVVICKVARGHVLPVWRPFRHTGWHERYRWCLGGHDTATWDTPEKKE